MKKETFSDRPIDNKHVGDPREGFTPYGAAAGSGADDDNMAESGAGADDNSANVAGDQTSSGRQSGAAAEGETGGGEAGTGVDPEAATDWKDKYLRLSAEFDNYRKRTLREKMELVASGGEDMARALLPVLDDMDRAQEALAGAGSKDGAQKSAAGDMAGAQKASTSASDLAAMKKGLELVFQKLHDTLLAKGLKELPAMGKEMDAELFDAVALVPGEAKHKGRVIDVVQKGYYMKDKVIRHAKVVVGD